jgi:hypothetical protein
MASGSDISAALAGSRTTAEVADVSSTRTCTVCVCVCERERVNEDEDTL